MKILFYERNKDYEKAADSYSKVNSDESKFNEADSLYKAKKYDEALKTYSSISNKELEFNKLYNMGNSYANLKDIEKAIKSYEDALKIKEDEDAKYNLEIIKKLQQQRSSSKENNSDNKQNNENSKDNQMGFVFYRSVDVGLFAELFDYFLSI